jgi:hypothetical protein
MNGTIVSQSTGSRRTASTGRFSTITTAQPAVMISHILQFIDGKAILWIGGSMNALF